MASNDKQTPVGLSSLLWSAAHAAGVLTGKAVAALAARVSLDGRIDPGALDKEQHAAHGVAWCATYAAVLGQLSAWEVRQRAAGRFGALDELLATELALEYARQIAGGIPMSQQEIVRPADMGLGPAAMAEFTAGGWLDLLCQRSTPQSRLRALELLRESVSRATAEDAGLNEDLDLMRDQFRSFADERIVPFAQAWHRTDALIPTDLLQRLASLGVFGLTIPERFGGAGLGKMAMCIVSEELSRGYLGVGSLATRSEIAAELILNHGSRTQQEYWLPRIATGKAIPTAAFTEPDTGSDLAAVRTRAGRDGNRYLVTGSKCWITHAARADLMTLLVRTNPALTDHRGLSMLLAVKATMREGSDFPSSGLSGSEIPVLGYRGMKEYTLAFDNFAVPISNLLGEVEGHGFLQLMATFESARIQTAARAIGVAQASFEAGLAYSIQRRQFGRLIVDFPRVHNKLIMTAAELLGVRQLTYFAARKKDAGNRCDLEAGMSKLLAARIAWAAADGALQVHGGTGYALDSPISRLLCDARVLSLFEGASEIQAHVIVRRLLEQQI